MLMQILMTIVAHVATWELRENSYTYHWNKNVVILTKFSSLAALEVVILTTSSAASDEHFIKMKTFPFQCIVTYVTTLPRQ